MYIHSHVVITLLGGRLFSYFVDWETLAELKVTQIQRNRESQITLLE